MSRDEPWLGMPGPEEFCDGLVKEQLISGLGRVLHKVATTGIMLWHRCTLNASEPHLGPALALRYAKKALPISIGISIAGVLAIVALAALLSIAIFTTLYTFAITQPLP